MTQPLISQLLIDSYSTRCSVYGQIQTQLLDHKCTRIYWRHTYFVLYNISPYTVIHNVFTSHCIAMQCTENSMCPFSEVLLAYWHNTLPEFDTKYWHFMHHNEYICWSIIVEFLGWSSGRLFLQASIAWKLIIDIKEYEYICARNQN